MCTLFWESKKSGLQVPKSFYYMLGAAKAAEHPIGTEQDAEQRLKPVVQQGSARSEYRGASSIAEVCRAYIYERSI